MPARAISPNGRRCWSAWTTRAAKFPSPWWASTWNTKTPIRASRKRCWMEAEGVAGEDWERQLEDYDGILVPGGFGKRGIDGMLNAIKFAREHKVPYFGICLGMQTLVIEFARNVCGLEAADSTEFNSGTPHRVIFKLRELKGIAA